MAKNRGTIVKAGRKTQPPLSREPGQISLDLPSVLYRLLPAWITPELSKAEAWRSFVYNQPFAMISRDTLIAYILALDWQIQARDSNERDELKSEIDYHTKFLEENNGLEYSTHVEWVLGDMLDLPFGGAVEVGREGDVPEGRVVWIEPIDGGTLFPEGNKDFPVGQRIEGYIFEPVWFPAHAINRIYMSPRREIKREGWGMAPPEKIYLAMSMLNRGDVYYANLLLDTPEAGILDLGDMSKESAEQWVESFRSLLGGIDPFKIPVLYEHENQVNFIPFGKPPTDLLYDRITLKYAAIVAAGYGLTLGDVGIGQATSGGDTLAGSIRQERRTRKTGFAVLKSKVRAYMNRFLPEALSFEWIDYDEELNVAKGRARLASATAYAQWVKDRIFSPKECRLQAVADGLVSISVPEDVPEEDFDILPEQTAFGTPERPGMLGNPQPPSTGGQGEATAGVGKSAAESSLHGVLKRAMDDMAGEANTRRVRKLIRKIAPLVYEQVKAAAHLSKSEMLSWKAEIEKADDELSGELEEPLEKDDWWLLPLDEDEIITILSLAYLEALRSAADEALYDLYEHGYLFTPYLDPNMIFKLENPFILQALREKAAQMVANVNEGTKYYLRRILVKSVREGLTDAEIIARIRNGIDIQEILSDNSFMQRLSQGVQREIANLPQHRIERIVSFELATARNAARVAQYKRMGLESKHWLHFGSDIPCDICQRNIEAGIVPLDYVYESVFGPTETGAAHPYEHCEVSYVGAELYGLAKRGSLSVWTGD